MANLCDDNLLTEWRTPDLDLVLHTIGETVIWGFMKHIFDILLQSVCLFHGHRQLKTENRLKLKLKWAVNHFRGNWQTKCEVKRSTIKVIVGGTWEGRILSRSASVAVLSGITIKIFHKTNLRRHFTLESAHQFIFSCSFTFLFVLCDRLSWLSVSFLLHVKYTRIVSYRIVWCAITTMSGRQRTVSPGKKLQPYVRILW